MLIYTLLMLSHSVVLDSLCKSPWTIIHQPPLSMDFPGKCTGWVAISFSRGFSQPRDQTHISRIGSSLVAQMVKCLPTMWEPWVLSLGQEDPLEKEMANHSSTLAWKIPWTEEAGRLQSIGLQRVRHDWATSLSLSLPHRQADSLPLSYLGNPNIHYVILNLLKGWSILQWIILKL